MMLFGGLTVKWRLTATSLKHEKGNIMKDLALGEEKNAKRLLKDKEKILVVFEETVMIIKKYFETLKEELSSFFFNILK